jgi:glucokinase
MDYVAGIDLGGTAINYTIADLSGRFLIDALFERPARAVEGPVVCLDQIAEGLAAAAGHAGIDEQAIVAVGLDTPGPASADGVLSARGSTNFKGASWAGFDLRSTLAQRLRRPVVYLNDGNAAALWGHQAVLGAGANGTSVTTVIGTGLGGGVVVDGKVLVGRNGFAGELGHVLIPLDRLPEIHGITPRCNCGRDADLESLCSLTAIRNTLLPYFLAIYPHHELTRHSIDDAARMVRGFAQARDPVCRAIFAVQAHALALFFDQMVNVFDPDVLIVGGGAIEASPDFQDWFLAEIRAGMPSQREEQAHIPLRIMPEGDTAGARGAAIEALRGIATGALVA